VTRAAGRNVYTLGGIGLVIGVVQVSYFMFITFFYIDKFATFHFCLIEGSYKKIIVEFVPYGMPRLPELLQPII